MRFLFLDRIVDFTPGKRLLATSTASIMDPFLRDHYARRPVMPATMVVEALAQVAGWLNLINNRFGINMVLALAEGIHLKRLIVPGDTLEIEANLLYGHGDGATFSASARVGGEPAATLDRMAFANETVAEIQFARKNFERFRYLCSGYDVPEEWRP